MIAQTRTPIMCDCCGTQKVGYVENGKIIWFIDAWRKRHTKVIDVKDFLTLSKNSVIDSTTIE